MPTPFVRKHLFGIIRPLANVNVTLSPLDRPGFPTSIETRLSSAPVSECSNVHSAQGDALVSLALPSERRLSMTTEKYLICSPTIALLLEDGRHVAHLVPQGVTVSIDGKTFNGNKLIEVSWADQIVMMFTQDLRTRGKKVD